MAIVNLLALALAAYFISIMSNQVVIHERDYQSEVLESAINYATQYAIEEALSRSDADQDQENLRTANFDPTYAIDDFARMMCLCYNMSLSEENIQLVKSSIDGGLFCVEDGYYKFMISETPVISDTDLTVPDGTTLKTGTYYNYPGQRTYIGYDVDGAEVVVNRQIQKTYNVEKDLVLSPKIPYVYPMDIDKDGVPEYYLSLNFTDSANRVYIPGQTVIKRNETDTASEYVDRYYYQNSKAYLYQLTRVTNTYHNYYGAVIGSDYLNDTLKLEELNLTLEQELNNSIKQITQARGKPMSYNVHLPSTTTSTGVNPIRNSTLIISMSKASFAGKYGYLAEPVLAGFKFVQRQRIVVFRDADGVVRYAYAIQAKPEANIIDSHYSIRPALQTTYKDGAGNDQIGVKPHFEYLNLPLRQDVY